MIPGSPGFQISFTNHPIIKIIILDGALSISIPYRESQHTRLLSLIVRFHTISATMPLVVPGMMGKNSIATNKKEEWMSKLLGKKITDSSSDNMVCSS